MSVDYFDDITTSEATFRFKIHSRYLQAILIKKAGPFLTLHIIYLLF